MTLTRHLQAITAILLLLSLLLAGCQASHRTGPEGALAQGDPFLVAMDSVNALIVASPNKASLYARRAKLLLGVDSLGPAQLDLERAIRLDSTNVEYRLMLGDLYYRTIQIPRSFAQFKKAAEIDPSNTSAILKQAEIQLVLRNYDRSMTLVNEALRKDQHAAHGYFLKGWIYMETGDTTLALSSFRTAVEQDAEDYQAYILLGKISAAKHDPLAEQYYATAISLRPRSVEAWYNKGMYYQENGHDSLALDCYRHIMEIDPRNALAWYNTGYIHLEHLNDPETAQQDFAEAVRLEPGYANAWYNRGLAFERMDQLDSAATQYLNVLDLDPAHDQAAQGLSRLERRGVSIQIRRGATRR